MIQDKNTPRFFDKQLRAKNVKTLIVLLVSAALFYGIAIIRLKTS